MKIDILNGGRIKNSFIKEGVNEYLKRLNTKGWQVTLKEKCSPAENCIFLSERGKLLSEKSFFSIFRTGFSGKILNFYIGKPRGFEKGFLKGKRAYSLSPLTMTSELTNLVFIEQIYRFWTLQQGKEYVK